MKRFEDAEGVMSLRRALQRARELGLEVRSNRGTGEVRIAGRCGERVNHNARRKDASRALMQLLRHEEQYQHRSGWGHGGYRVSWQLSQGIDR